MYLKHPVLFGGATGNGGLDLLNFGSIKDGKLVAAPGTAAVSFVLYQLATQSISSGLNGVVTPTVDALTFVLTKLGPTLTNLECSLPLT